MAEHSQVITIEIPLGLYDELIRKAERVDVITRRIQNDKFMSYTELRNILDIKDER